MPVFAVPLLLLALTPPSDPRSCLEQTQLYARRKEVTPRTETALHCIELAHAAPDWQSSGSVHNYLGKVYLADAHFANALAEYREAIRLEPSEESYRFDLAQAQLGHEMFAEAASTLEDARQVFDKSPQIELALGVAYYGQRRFPEAVNSFLRTIQLAPEIAQPYVFLGKMIDQAGDRLPEIQQRLSEFQSANPDNYIAYLLLAKVVTDPDRQLTLLNKSIELKPDNWESRYELGVLLETAHDFERSAKELELSAKLNPDVAATHYHLARVYDRLKRSEVAAQQRTIHQKLIAHEKITAGME